MNGWQNGALTLTNENATDLHLLTPAEQQLCSSLRILPKPYLVMKEVLMKEAMKHGGVLKKKAAREICRVSSGLLPQFLPRVETPHIALI